MPLIYFLFAWFVLLAIYGIMSLISVVQMLRFGITGPGTYFSTFIYLGVVLVVIGGTSIFLLTVDWSQTISIFGALRSSLIFNP